jgi:DNA processing protein
VRHAAGLAALPLQTPARLRRLVKLGDPSSTWARIMDGERVIPGVDERVWRAWRGCRGLEDTVARRCEEAGIGVTWLGGPGYPAPLLGDLRGPGVLFHRGDLTALARRRVGIIGTRAASRAGAAFARRLGNDLALNDVAVVSGLARGIDIAAHRGALVAVRGAPVAVVAGGVDVTYPPEHGAERDEIAGRGVVVSEAPPGTAPETHRFPLRNRILAGLCEVLVVVESRARGGSMITVREAMMRDVTVLAVPGSPSMPVSDGTNALLRDGCGPVTDVDDVMIALGLATGARLRSVDTRRRPGAQEQFLLDAFGGTPRTCEELVLATGQERFDVGVMLGRLEADGWVAHDNGWWEALTA